MTFHSGTKQEEKNILLERIDEDIEGNDEPR